MQRSEETALVIFDVLMLVRARFFVGNPYSTLTRNVARVRSVGRPESWVAGDDAGAGSALGPNDAARALDSNIAIGTALCQLQPWRRRRAGAVGISEEERKGGVNSEGL